MFTEFEQRRPSNAQQFGDNQQLFLGNIPHHASEEELRQLFARFGNVIDLRILSKVNSKMLPGMRSPLNYGFITYDDSEAVQKCLANCVCRDRARIACHLYYISNNLKNSLAAPVLPGKLS